MAGPFSPDFIESVRNAGDITRLVSDYVPLKQAGTRLKGLCPFHEEKTPSFSVEPQRQLFYCFGCQTGGDIFKFVQLYEKVDFGEAVELLAKRWGVPLPPRAVQPENDPLERLRRINAAAQAFFRARLADAEGGAACRAYLEKRGLDPSTVERLGLGFAPDGWEALRGHLLAKRFSPEEILRAGLTLPRKTGDGEYDRFRGRLIFPIRDLSSRPVAFGGRTLGADEPKYINSPETPLYTKGDQLYGLDQAKESIRREGFAIVVEGYLDLAALVQAGFENVVASCGTAFTPSQSKLLARFTQRVVFSYDGDNAGAKATERSLGLLLEKGFEVRVVELPGGCDPDDFIRREGADAYGSLLRRAPGYLQFLIDKESGGARDLTRIEERVAAVNAVLPHLSRLQSPIERASWAGRLADALHIDDALVLQELRTAVRGSRTAIRQRARSTRQPRDAEQRLVYQLLHSPDERVNCCEELDPADLEGVEVARIVEVILAMTREGRTVDFPTVLEALGDEADKQILTRIAFRDEPEEGPSVSDCLWALRRSRLSAEGRRVRGRIDQLQRNPEASNDLDRHLTRLQELARQRDALHRGAE